MVAKIHSDVQILNDEPESTSIPWQHSVYIMLMYSFLEPDGSVFYFLLFTRFIKKIKNDENLSVLFWGKYSHGDLGETNNDETE